LPAYARYLSANKLNEFVGEQIRLSREVNLPLLKHLKGMTEEQIIDFASEGAKEFLNKLALNQAQELITASLKQWIANEIPKINQDQILQDDIGLVSFVRKKALLKFLPAYTTDVTLIIDIVNEIDAYITESQSSSLNVYINLLHNKIEEHVHFIEKINNTSPGIVYVFDLEEQKEIYSNNNLENILGYRREDKQTNVEYPLANIFHPDDSANVSAHIKSLSTISDGEICSFRYRAKDKSGQYKWMRNYETVFKRTHVGQVKQIIGISLDVDKEKKTAEQLQAREEQLLEAQELAGMGSYEWNINTNEVRTTPQVYKILGIEKGEQLPGYLKHVHPADRGRVSRLIESAISTNTSYEYECRYVDKDVEKIIWAKGAVFTRDGNRILKGTLMDVTERHHMVQRLQRSEDLYKEAQAITHIGNWTWELKQDNITWSDELYRIFDLQPQNELITFEKFTSFILPDDKEYVTENIHKSLQNKTSSETYFRIITAAKAIKILHAKTQLRLDEEGIPFKMVGTVQDVTQQKNTEKQLLENQTFIKKIADATPAIVASYNINNGRYTFISQGLQKLLGYEPEDAMKEGVPFFVSKVHPDDLPKLMEKNASVLKAANESNGKDDNEIIIEFQYRMLHKNGQYRWFQTYGTVFDRNNQNQVEHVLNISLDITEKLETETKLQEQESFTQHIADASPTILYLFDLEENKFLYVNREVYDVLGYKPNEVMALGSQVGMLLHAEDEIKSPDNYIKYKHSFGESSMHEFEGRVLNKDNKWKWLLTREIVFKRDENGKALQVIGSALDITERKEMEQALIYKTLQLQQSNASLEEFAHVASHDLQEPLRKISTFGDRLLSTYRETLGTDGQGYLDRIIKSTHRMQQLIQDILSLSMISGDKNFQVYSLQAALEEVLQTLDYKIEKTKAEIISDGLPQANVVPSQFRQLFQNLLSNSLKFVRTDVTPRIEIKHRFISAAKAAQYHLKGADKFLKLTFEDNGIGFQDIYAEKIFTIFQRLHGRSEYEGTGIGLAICKKIVENHEGVILAKSAEQKGATFTIIIPTIA
jgi:PAS domain S-box-containing protein